ncbi:MAG: transglycosylase SLT domain-containing protein [Sandaracinaceae bacterium]|nr:transglycosylase SLT domain-containing protein [Sandaracinaceae bacterium]
MALLFATLSSTAGAQDDPSFFTRTDTVRGAIARAVREHDAESALDTIDAMPDDVRARPDVIVARVHLAESLDRHDEVARDLARARTLLPAALQPWAAETRARALLFLGRADEAEIELATIASAPARVRALSAEAAAIRGDRARAIELAQPLVRDDPADVDTFALRMMLAEASRSAGERDRSTSELRVLLLERPSHPDAARAEAVLASWLGTPRVAWTADERMRRASRLLLAHQASRALRELEPIPRPGADEPVLGAWLSARGNALYESRAGYAEAAQLLAESARVNGNARHRFLAARALLRADREREGLRALRAFVRDEPSHASAPEAEWLIGATLLRGGHPREGRRALEAFVRGPRARRSAGLRREAEWHLALLDFDAGHMREAADRFRGWGAGARGSMDRGRALYWEGRAAYGANDGARGERAMRAAIAADPLGWYAIWAASRLREHGEDPGPPVPDDAPAEASFAPLAEPALVTFHATLGLDHDAAQLLRAAERARGWRPGSRRALVERFTELGDPSRAYRLTGVSELLTHAPRREAEWVWRAAYPRPFEADVAAASRASGVAPEVIYAVMRQESAFDARVVSYADAIGLMQLLPDTAARYARASTAPFGRELLYRPEHNVRFGAAYLRDLVDDVGIPLCFAAYNAGENRVHEWLARARRDGGPTGRELDRMVEDIPFLQTRNYIRRVTGSYAHYLYAAHVAAGGATSDWPDLALPARVGGEAP